MLKKNEKQLSVVQQKAIGLIVSKDINGLTIEQIADELGVSKSTIYKWQREDPHFIDELNKQAEQVMDSFLVECYQVLQKIIRDDKEPTKNKLLAVDKVMKIKQKYVDKQEISIDQKRPEQIEVMRHEVIEMQKELLSNGVVTPEELEDISSRWSGNIENIKNELEVIKLEKELLD